jgi:hypothetical protein
MVTKTSDRTAARAPRSVPIVAMEPEEMVLPDQPFEEGAQDALNPELRHRMISEAAYSLYAARGYADGYDIEDWLVAEAEVDHVLLSRAPDAESGAPG